MEFGCGVKGNPQPPDVPPYIGTGLMGTEIKETSPPGSEDENLKLNQSKEASPTEINPATASPAAPNTKTSKSTKKPIKKSVKKK